MKNVTLFLIATLFFLFTFLLPQTAIFAQQHYGDLELTVLGNGYKPAINIPVKAVDEDLGTTTHKTTDNNSQAFFEDLYIYTIDNIPEQNEKKIPSLEGVVKIYNILGQQVDEKIANNGTVLFDGVDHTASPGIHILQDSKGHSLKFLYMNEPTLLGREIPSGFKFGSLTETRTYELHADGRNLEFNPFAEFMELHELEADIINYVELNPPVVADRPATGQVEILVNGAPASDNSQVKIVETGTTDTTYLVTTNGIALFDANDGVTSHPFGNYTRAYSILINSFNADNNWFHAETNAVEMALGSGNNFTFNPSPITDAQRTADITLEIILTNNNPASADAQVKTYRLGSTDTTFAYTNSSGIAEFSRLVHPFQSDAHEIAINSNACSNNLFDPLTESHSLVVGQNDIEMNPEPVSQNFAEGPVQPWHNNSNPPGVEISIWRLNNTIDTVMYISSAGGVAYYEDLPLEGSSSDYVFQSFKEPANGDPILTSLDTFNLVSGSNPMQNIYLEAISQFITNTGTLRYAFNQSSFVSGANVEIREVNNGPVIGSDVTDANGFYSISGIPSGAQTEFVVNGVANHFDKVNAFNFEEVYNYSDTLVENQNMMVYALAWSIPQMSSDPAPATVSVAASLIEQLVGSDAKNAEEFIRGEKRMHLTNFAGSTMNYALAVEAAIDSLFYGGQGSSIVFVPNAINITSYHQQNYDPLVGFLNELGHNVTNGGGNNTSTIYSTPATGTFILGGTIHITGGVNNLESAIKEWIGRAEDMGDTDTQGMMFAGQTTMPNHTERAYHSASNINLTARIVDGYEMFSLKGLTTSSKAPSNQAPALANPPVKDDSFIEDAEVVYDYLPSSK